MTTEYEICGHCDYPKPEGEACPNPACWAGMKAYNAAMTIWKLAMTLYVQRERAKRFPGLGGLNAGTMLAEEFERKRPRPDSADYEEKING